MENYQAKFLTNTKISVVINTCYGGFDLSGEGLAKYRGLTNDSGSIYDIDRRDLNLVAVVREMGKQASGLFSALKIIQIPSYMKDFYEITEYVGIERIKLLKDNFKISQIKLINNDDDLTDAEKRVLINQIIEHNIPEPFS